MKKIIALLCLATATNGVFAIEPYIPKVKARDYKDINGCVAFTTTPINQGRGVVLISLYETCDTMVEFELLFGLSTGRYLSSVSKFKLDCKTRKFAWLWEQQFSEQFWRTGQQPSKASEPILFRSFDTEGEKSTIFDQICNESNIAPSS